MAAPDSTAAEVAAQAIGGLAAWLIVAMCGVIAFLPGFRRMQ